MAAGTLAQAVVRSHAQGGRPQGTGRRWHIGAQGAPGGLEQAGVGPGSAVTRGWHGPDDQGQVRLLVLTEAASSWHCRGGVTRGGEELIAVNPSATCANDKRLIILRKRFLSLMQSNPERRAKLARRVR